MKGSKENYYIKYFESDLTNIKNTWKCIKSIIYVRSSSLITPTFQNKPIDNLERIANVFNKHFSTIGEKTQAKIKCLHKNYTELHLTNENPNSFFLSPTDKEEIKLILSS